MLLYRLTAEPRTAALEELAGDAYERIERSGFRLELDLALIARLAVREDQHEALHELRSLL